MEAPVINVGVLTDEKAVSFVFNTAYVLTETGAFLTGEQHALFVGGKIIFNGKPYLELFFEPTSPEATFDLKAVTIGNQFHWQRKEDQRFKGALNLVIDNEGITAINQVDAEEYLTNVISSEMSASASKELLKAHAIISRSWLFSQIEKKWQRSNQNDASSYPNEQRSCNELIRWYDQSEHTIFDVCADDHCQRYQSVTRAFTPAVKEAVQETRGEVLMFNGMICDTRFSKCCGGASEQFESCWEPVRHPYLTSVRDLYHVSTLPDLTQEKEADKWIRSNPDAFCQKNNPEIIKQILNNYDQETTDFYRWEVAYTQEQLSNLIYRKSGIDFGQIMDLIPVERGTSGRIIKLKVVGTLCTFTFGKELEIRRILSESHLYSSAFVVDKELRNDIPTLFRLKGAGWGHGVGLCQIGAAVMSTQGYDYRQILAHYYPGSTLEKRY